MRRSSTRSSAVLAGIAALAAACSSETGTGPGDEATGVLFLAREAPASAVMDALFEGTVKLDARGCLRLDSGRTVVWPYGFEPYVGGGALRVRDAAGRDVGRVGGGFRFGGGEVDALHDGLGLPAAARAEAEARCPGGFWVVGEVP